jgi:hypothetical protein
MDTNDNEIRRKRNSLFLTLPTCGLVVDLTLECLDGVNCGEALPQTAEIYGYQGRVAGTVDGPKWPDL